MRSLGTLALLFFLIHDIHGQTDFEEVKIGCINLSRIGNERVVRSAEEYEALKASLSPHPDCSSYTFPEIDFHKHTLVGYHLQTGGCAEPIYKVQVRKDGQAVTIVFQVKTNGICKALFEKMIWLTIPNTEFEVRFKREKLQ